jgi:DNA polymerase III epsilon subunit-like protein
MKLSDVDFVALDLEATGVAWGHDRIVEVGAVRFRIVDGHSVPGERFHALVNPGLPIPTVVSRITGLDDAAVAEAPPLEARWDELVRFLDGTTVLAHGARADLTWLGSEALRLSRPPPRATFHCTLELARKTVPKAPRYTLTALITHLGLGGESAPFHRAMADALHTRNLFVRCAALAEARTLEALELDALAWPGPEVFSVRIPDRLRPLVELIAAQSRCSIVYRGGSAGRDPRPVTPLGLFAHEGVPYLRAWCHRDDVGKSFRCDRISAVVAPEQHPSAD